MSSICVRCVSSHILAGLILCRSIYQDIPLHSVEEFQELAPEEARTHDVLGNPHQLMLNRLSFELAERQRYDTCPNWLAAHQRLISYRLDHRRKELILHKEELLKQSRMKSTTVESVKSQIDALTKVHLFFLPPLYYLILSPDCNRDPEESRRVGTTAAIFSRTDAGS